MPAQKLLDLGAESVGGFVYLNRTHVGTYTHGGFVLTAAGEEALKAAPAAAPGPAPARAARAPKVEKVVAPSPQPSSDTLDLQGDLDKLLAGE